MRLKEHLNAQIISMHNKFTKKISGFNIFFGEITKYTQYTNDYISNLDYILKYFPYTPAENPFAEIMNFLKELIFHQRESLADYNESIFTGILEPGNKIILSSTEIEKKALIDLRKIQKEYTDALNNVDKDHTKLDSELKAIETSFWEYESIKEIIPTNERISIEETHKRKINYTKEWEKSYCQAISFANDTRCKFVEKTENIFKSLGNIDVSFMNAIQENIHSLLVVYSMRNTKEKSTIDELSKTIERINCNTFLEPKEVFTPIFPEIVKYIPYKLNSLQSYQSQTLHHRHHVNQSQTHSWNELHNVIIKMKSNFENIAMEYEVKSEEAKLDLLRISRSIIENIHQSPWSSSDHGNWFKYLKESKYRLEFLTYLNLKRAEGKFEIKKTSFRQLGEIMRFIVDRVNEDKDFETLRYCIIMCQTYCFINKEGKKIYLVKYIDNHNWFKNNVFWEYYFSENIYQEIEKQNNNVSASENETEKQKNQRYSNVVFSKLLSIAHNMMEFRINKVTIKDLIHTFSSQYNVDKMLVEQIDILVDEIKYDIGGFDENKDLTEKEDEEKGGDR